MNANIDSSSNVTSTNEYTGSVDIPLARIVLAALCPLLLAAGCSYLKLNISKMLVWSLVRSTMQLFLLGYVMLGFIFAFHSPWLVVGYVFVMIAVSTLEVTSRHAYTYPHHMRDSFYSIFFGSGIVVLIANFAVFRSAPWWSPRVFIPTAGMIIGSALSAPTIGLNRLLSDAVERRHEVETRLAFGASDPEAVLPLLRPAMLAALLPALNQLAIVGLVSIPGMMTGHLLAGASPGVTAQYQMAITWMICTSALVTTFVALSLAVRRAVFDNCHRLATGLICKRTKDSDQGSTFSKISSAVSRVFCCLAYCPNSSAHDVNRSERQPSTARSPSSRQQYNPLMATEDQILGSNAASEANSGAVELMELSRGSAGKATFSVLNESTTVNKSVDRGSTLLSIHGLNVLSGDRPLLEVSAGLDLALARGERVTLEGPSGLGKTRLLRAIAQLDAPLHGYMTCGALGSVGNIATDSTSWWSPCFGLLASASTAVPEWRRRVIYIPQALPVLDGTPAAFLKECCAYKCRAQDGVDATTITNECRRLESDLLLAEGKLDQNWSTLSGGERQRAVIACALILASTVVSSGIDLDILGTVVECVEEGDSGDRGHNGKPAGRASSHAVLLLDEPTAACDAASCAAVERAIVASGAAVVVITHDDKQAQRLAHRRIILTPQE